MYEKLILQNIMSDVGASMPATVTASESPVQSNAHAWSEQDLVQLEEAAKHVIATSTNVVAIERAERLMAAINEQREYPTDA
jgi:hypothetical protein